MSRAFAELSPTALLELAAAIRSGAVRPPFMALTLGRLGIGESPVSLAAEMTELANLGTSPGALARMLSLLADERMAAQQEADHTELVWTGPEVRGSCSRDTSVVVRELFKAAEHSVLVSSYAVYDGRGIFEPLAARMDAAPAMQVRLFLNVMPSEGRARSINEELKAFGDHFLRYHWPGERVPDVYYDPRSLAPEPAGRAVLHAKVVVVDECQVLVTSANFTEAAHERNIEAGIVARSRTLAQTLRMQFDTLVEAGQLRRLPLHR